MERVTKMAFKISQFLDHMAGWAIAATMLLVVGNVILRLFGYPLGGTYEWVGFLTAVAVGLSLAYCAALGGHVAVTLFVEKLPTKAQAAIDVLTASIVLLFLAMTSWELAAYGTSVAASGEVASTTKVPIYPFIYLIALGFLVFGLVLLSVVIESIRKVARK
ncbi:MAG: TRAP transporter small permease subunit [Bacillota bacterium]